MNTEKNYSNCPLKKRPIPVFEEEVQVDIEPEQKEPVNLCMKPKRVKLEVDNVYLDGLPPSPPLSIASRSLSPILQPQKCTTRPPLPISALSIPNASGLAYKRDINHHTNDNLRYIPYGQPSTHIKQEPSTAMYSPYSQNEYYLPVPDHHHYQQPQYASAPQYPSYMFKSATAHQQPLSPISFHSTGSPSPRLSMSPSSTSGSEDLYQVYHHTHHHQQQLPHQQPHTENLSPPLYEDLSNNHPKSTPGTASVRRYHCTECSKSYSTYAGLTKHTQFHCPATQGNQAKKVFRCEECGKQNKSMSALKMHIRTHTLPNKCTMCGKAFSRPWLLQGHIRTHTGEKPFSCDSCHRSFADRSNLRAHSQTHMDVKKFGCNTCGKTYSRVSLLTKHVEGGCPGLFQNVPTDTITKMPSSSPGRTPEYSRYDE